jgi:hypothetical protein
MIRMGHTPPDHSQDDHPTRVQKQQTHHPKVAANHDSERQRMTKWWGGGILAAMVMVRSIGVVHHGKSTINNTRVLGEMQGEQILVKVMGCLGLGSDLGLRRWDLTEAVLGCEQLHHVLD